MSFRLFPGIGGVLLALCGAAPSHAASSGARGKVVVVSQLSFLSVEELEFGNILPSATAGTVTISPAGARTRTGGVTLVGGGLVQAARFAGKGTVGQTVLISVPTATITLRRAGGTETMLADTFIIGSTPTVQLTTVPRAFTIGNAAGIFSFPVGGTLRVNANQVPGDYSGTLTINLNYQ